MFRVVMVLYSVGLGIALGISLYDTVRGPEPTSMVSAPDQPASAKHG